MFTSRPPGPHSEGFLWVYSHLPQQPPNQHTARYFIMALIKCRGCGRDISDKEEKCPNCGRPITNTKRYQQFYKPAELHPADDTPQEPKHNYQVSYYQEPPKRQKPKRGSALAVVSLMVSIISCTFPSWQSLLWEICPTV